ncbi:GntR family transcriptional regulator [Paenibacillus filicis]|uniref:GntR family transcriptional regulator n=1 Tax=Paenibacillus gyeongsangnamensis TaxID=3388067 RepID=A0ABT4Q4V2_9BACL|nr:GntR family transcriptional regulator [Paenibacillus filicis]MCZ8511822.1 GntR family transcriptional regulator [Paenibacillus filicis]
MNPISSNSRPPLYKQLRQYILDQIQQKVWLPDQQIPSENELAEQFQVSRVTVRGALSELVDEGAIYRIRGKGSFVQSGTLTSRLPDPIAGSEPGSGKIVAFLMPRLDNRFTANVVSGIESELSKHGYHLLFCKTHDSKEIEKQKLQEMISFGVDGIIVYPVADESYNEDILKLSLDRFPLVVVDRYLRGVDTNCVCSDNMEGARQATSHLIKLGHRRIAYINSDLQTTSLEDRLTGYQKALGETSLPIDYRLQVSLKGRSGKTDPGNVEILTHFFQSNPDVTACFAAHYALAFDVIHVLNQLGKKLPEEMSLVCFDEYESAEHAALPLTCVEQQEYRLGEEAAKLLISNMESPGQERKMTLIPTRFIKRSSTAPV